MISLHNVTPRLISTTCGLCNNVQQRAKSFLGGRDAISISDRQGQDTAYSPIDIIDHLHSFRKRVCDFVSRSLSVEVGWTLLQSEHHFQQAAYSQKQTDKASDQTDGLNRPECWIGLEVPPTSRHTDLDTGIETGKDQVVSGSRRLGCGETGRVPWQASQTRRFTLGGSEPDEPETLQTEPPTRLYLRLRPIISLDHDPSRASSRGCPGGVIGRIVGAQEQDQDQAAAPQAEESGGVLARPLSIGRRARWSGALWRRHRTELLLCLGHGFDLFGEARSHAWPFDEWCVSVLDGDDIQREPSVCPPDAPDSSTVYSPDRSVVPRFDPGWRCRGPRRGAPSATDPDRLELRRTPRRLSSPAPAAGLLLPPTLLGRAAESIAVQSPRDALVGTLSRRDQQSGGHDVSDQSSVVH